MKTIQLILPMLLLSFLLLCSVVAADDAPQGDPVLDLINVLGCKGCHTINKEGGSIANDLTQIGSRLTADQIKKKLATGVTKHPNIFMPDYSSLSTSDLKRISAYLYNLQ